jgi:hypothetical protein
MRNKPSLTELVRDAALDDDFSIDEGLVLIKRLNVVYGSDKATKKALNRLADILIGIQERRRTIHQTAEEKHRAELEAHEQCAQLL